MVKMVVAVLPKQDRDRFTSAIRRVAASTDEEGLSTTVDEGGIRIAVDSEPCQIGLRLTVSVTLAQPEDYVPRNMIGFPEHLDGLASPCPNLSEELVTLVYDALDGQIGYFEYNSESPPSSPEYLLETTFPR